MTVSAAVDELIRTSQKDPGRENAGWDLTDYNRPAVGQLVAHLHWIAPAQLPQPTAVQLHDAAAEVAVAAVATEGELAWTLSQIARELFTLVRSVNELNLPQLREPTPAELTDAGAALRRLREFLSAIQSEA